MHICTLLYSVSAPHTLKLFWLAPHGTVFGRFSIPYVPVSIPDVNISVGVVEIPMEITAVPGLKPLSSHASSILLIDDTKVLLGLQALALEVDGYTVTKAYGANEGQ